MSCCGGGPCKPASNPVTSSDTVTSPEAVEDAVKEYYGKILSDNTKLETDVCLLNRSSMPKHVRQAFGEIHEEILSRYYGCGLVIPENLDGASVLDLGSGAGQDCFILSKLVGDNGHVTGLDMTDEQLEIARQYIPYHTEKFGYTKPNVEFVKGYIERLGEAGLNDNSFDHIISNCVINLSPDKESVLREAYRTLKVGGEMYFSDIYADRDLPDETRKHKLLWRDCLAGALWWKDLVRLAKEIGFSPPRLVTARTFVVKDTLKPVLGDDRFVSVTYRLFKLPSETETSCDAIYKGSILGHETTFKLDICYEFPAGKPVPVDNTVATILTKSRLEKHFSFQPSTTETPYKDPVVSPFDVAANTATCGADGPCKKEGCSSCANPCCGNPSCAQ